MTVDYTFTFTNGTGSADYTTTIVTVTVPAGATGTVSVPTTADTIAESMRPLLLPLERLRLLEQSMIMMSPTVATIAPASTEGSCCVWIQLSNPSAIDVDYTFTFTNGTAGADYTTTTLT
jgi:hypothetical protein